MNSSFKALLGAALLIPSISWAAPRSSGLFETECTTDLKFASATLSYVNIYGSFAPVLLYMSSEPIAANFSCNDEATQCIGLSETTQEPIGAVVVRPSSDVIVLNIHLKSRNVVVTCKPE